MKYLKLTIAMLLFFITIQAKAQRKDDQRTLEWRYEIQCEGIGTDGNWLVKVFTYSDGKKNPMEQAKKNAVHGIIFKGIPGNKSNGCYSQKPICTNPNIEFEKKEFFDTFFQDGGKYMKYVFDSSDGNIGPGDRMKVGKEYKTGIVVTVAKDALRKDLEAAGILKSLKDF